MVNSLLFMVVIPLFLGFFVNEISKGKADKNFGSYLQPFGKIALFLAVTITASKVSSTILQFKFSDIGILLMVFVLTGLGFILGYFNQFRNMSEKENISISCGVGLRNNTVTLIIATTYYSPITALPIIAGLLVQQLLASTLCKLIYKKTK